MVQLQMQDLAPCHIMKQILLYYPTIQQITIYQFLFLILLYLQIIQHQTRLNQYPITSQIVYQLVYPSQIVSQYYETVPFHQYRQTLTSQLVYPSQIVSQYYETEQFHQYKHTLTSQLVYPSQIVSQYYETEQFHQYRAAPFSQPIYLSKIQSM